MWAHGCYVREHIAVVEIGYAAISDEEPAARATLCAKGEHTKRSSGALEERSGNGSTHRGLILVHLASVEVGHAIRRDEEPAAAIKCGLCRRRARVTFQRGAGAELHEGSKCKRT